MKQIIALFFAILVLAACKEEPPIDTSEPLAKRIIGTWQVTEIQYNGIAPNPFDPTQSVLFSGAGKNVQGHFKFESDTNLGEFDLEFIAEADLGLAAPITYNMKQKRSGIYEVLETQQIVRMTNFAGDSIYDWEVRENKPNRQKWFVQMWVEFGSSGSERFPVNVEATMTR